MPKQTQTRRQNEAELEYLLEVGKIKRQSRQPTSVALFTGGVEKKRRATKKKTKAKK